MKKMSKEEENVNVVIIQLNTKNAGETIEHELACTGKGGACAYFAPSPISLIVPLSHRLSFRHLGKIFS
jgi:hypothetical protein